MTRCGDEITEERMPHVSSAPVGAVQAAGDTPAQARRTLGRSLAEASPALILVVALAVLLGPWGRVPVDFGVGPRLRGSDAVVPPRPPLVPPAAIELAAEPSLEPVPTPAPKPTATPKPTPTPRPTPAIRRPAPAAPLPEPAPTPPAAHPVEVTLTSRPLGEPVSVDGTLRGNTPLRLTLAPGRHRVTFGAAGTVVAEIEVGASEKTLWTYLAAEGEIR